ncbi:MAG: tetratricopeptide repeat protein [Bacteroidetes bacterium]|nr:tetratricopeptide repeat protein [Bacteroidota bacterium]
MKAHVMHIVDISPACGLSHHNTTSHPNETLTNHPPKTQPSQYVQFNIDYYINYIYISFNRILIACLLSVPTLSLAQEMDVRIANEYFLKGEKEKALAMYQVLSRNAENIPAIHTNYLSLLLDMGKYKEAEDYVEKVIRKVDDRITYRVDLGIVYVRSGETSKADKYFKALVKSNIQDVYRTKSISDYLAAHNLPDYAIWALQELRQSLNNPTIFTLEMANLYRMQGKRDEMVEEYLRYITQSPTNLNYVKNLLQLFLNKPDELESLEHMLVERVQKNPESEVYADLLIWVNLQQKNFYGAYIQARAYDKRFRKENSKTLEIAQIALNNKDYENADRSFSYVVREFPNTDNYLPARLGLIKAREAKVKTRFPVNRDSVRYLTREYLSFIARYPDNANSYEAILSEGMLHAYYLDEKDSAILKLTALSNHPRVAPYLKAKAKLELGDIYILKEEPWEATLLYSQVEKNQRDAPLGYEAKLRNAKLSYYKGDFRLAQEHLDILKQATSREIANDAMDLSMRIKENTAFDSTAESLHEFASIELLLVQNKDDEALRRMDLLARGFRLVGTNEEALQYPNRAILDDLYWLEAGVRLKRGEFPKALELLEKIVLEYGDDIYADDAYFTEGEIYERQLKDKEKAMEIYRNFLDKYPGSVYAAEARKRYRILRGDFQPEKLPN